MASRSSSPSASRGVPPAHNSPMPRRHGDPLPRSPTRSPSGRSRSPSPGTAVLAHTGSKSASLRRSSSPEALHGGESSPAESPPPLTRLRSPSPGSTPTAYHRCSSPMSQPRSSSPAPLHGEASLSSPSPSSEGQSVSPPVPVPAPAPAPLQSIIRTVWGRLSGSKRQHSDMEEPPSSPSASPSRRDASSTLPPPSGLPIRIIGGRVTGAKRRRPDDCEASPPPAPKRRQIGRFTLLLSLASDRLFATILRRIKGAYSLLRQLSPPLPHIPDPIMCLVLMLLPIRQIIRCSVVCKAYRSIICSNEFRSICRSTSNFRGPLLAAFTHPYVFKSPVAKLTGPFSELKLNLDFGGRDFSFVADSRDGYLLMFRNLTPPHQRFSVCNPLTQMVVDLPLMRAFDEYLAYIAASFIPDEDSNDFEVIVLYRIGITSHVRTALYNSKLDDWFFDDHDVAFTTPNSFLRIRQPSILIERQLTILFIGHHAISIDMKFSKEACEMKKRLKNQRTVSLSHIPLPVEFQGTGICLNRNNPLGKIGGKLCFLGAADGGITIWSCSRTAQGYQVFDEPRELTVAGQKAPRMMLLGFAESNEVLMLQRNLASDVILLIKMGTNAIAYLTRDNQELFIFAYEMQYPLTSILKRHRPPAKIDIDDHSSD